MSIPLECINIVIPIHVLRSKCNTLGDIDEFLLDRESNGFGSWRDEHLYREGAMDPISVATCLDEWKRNGLKPTRRKDGVLHWHDLCVVDTFSGPTLPCSWLGYDSEKGIAWFTGA